MSKFLKALLMFLNVLEEDRADENQLVLSISKVGMWAGIVQSTYVVIFRDGSTPAELIASIAIMTGTMANYMWRRYVHNKTGKIIGGE